MDCIAAANVLSSASVAKACSLPVKVAAARSVKNANVAVRATMMEAPPVPMKSHEEKNM